MTHETVRDVPDWLTLPSRDLRRAAFIARLTAGATHEMRNVLAIVKESAGLVADLVEVAGPDGAPSQEKTRWALERIQLQVARGANLSTSLNRIMHGLDHDEERVELKDAALHTTALTRRFAHQRGRAIQLEEGDAVEASASAMDVYMALVAVMEWCLERLSEGGTLVVRPEGQRQGAAVAFRAQQEDTRWQEIVAAAPATLGTALAALGGRLERTDRDGALLLRFDGWEVVP